MTTASETVGDHSSAHSIHEPSPWIRRFSPLVPRSSSVLDIAAGHGRHTRLFHSLKYTVTAVDRNIAGLGDLEDVPEVRIVEHDLEAGLAWPFADHSFSGVVVTNYLYRPLLPVLVDAVTDRGILLYETFARGNEQFGRPRNPDFLLKPGELLEMVSGRFRVLAYEDLIVDDPQPRAIQRICARKE